EILPVGRILARWQEVVHLYHFSPGGKKSCQWGGFLPGGKKWYICTTFPQVARNLASGEDSCQVARSGTSVPLFPRWQEILPVGRILARWQEVVHLYHFSPG